LPCRKDELRAAARTSSRWPDRAAAAAAFAAAALNPDGGFRGRDAASDLYYTVFALNILTALETSFPRDRTVAYLDTFGDGGKLDLVHLCCLVRCRAHLGLSPEPARREAVLAALGRYRAAEGGYGPSSTPTTGTAYACFLAAGARADLEAGVPDTEGILRCLDALATPDGAYTNERGMTVGLTPATAAAAILRRAFGADTDPGLGDWLLARVAPDGGFRAMPAAPWGDLLSTATALHALAALGRDAGPARDDCLAFVESMQAPDGGFRGAPDDPPDVEYTWYGLLALGHLAGAP
jgi:prenyltransferase beta subunit